MSHSFGPAARPKNPSRLDAALAALPPLPPESQRGPIASEFGEETARLLCQFDRLCEDSVEAVLEKARLLAFVRTILHPDHGAWTRLFRFGQASKKGARRGRHASAALATRSGLGRVPATAEQAGVADGDRGRAEEGIGLSGAMAGFPWKMRLGQREAEMYVAIGENIRADRLTTQCIARLTSARCSCGTLANSRA